MQDAQASFKLVGLKTQNITEIGLVTKLSCHPRAAFRCCLVLSSCSSPDITIIYPAGLLHGFPWMYQNQRPNSCKVQLYMVYSCHKSPEPFPIFFLSTPPCGGNDFSPLQVRKSHLEISPRDGSRNFLDLMDFIDQG